MKLNRRIAFFTAIILLGVVTPSPAQAAAKAPSKSESSFLNKVYNSAVKSVSEDDTLELDQIYYFLPMLEDLFAVPSNKSAILAFSKGICSRLNKSASSSQLRLAESFAARELANAVNAISTVDNEDDLWYQVMYVSLLDQAAMISTAKGGLCPKQAVRGSKLYNNVNPVIMELLDKVVTSMYSGDESGDELYDEVE
jgi:hypothetical protein